MLIEGGLIRYVKFCYVIKFLNSVDKEVNKIWNQASSTGYIIARCGDVNLTDEDIVSLKGNNWLTDQVVNIYMYIYIYIIIYNVV